MKATSIVLFILGAVTAVSLYLFSGYLGNTLFIMSCLIFLIIGTFNLIIMVEKKTSKKFLWVHMIPVAMFLVAIFYFMIKMKNYGIYTLPYLLPYLIPHMLSFGALASYLEFTTQNQAKDKRIADLEAEIMRLKNDRV